MRRLLSAGWLLPVLLATVGVALIVAGQLDLGTGVPRSSLLPIPEPSPSAVAVIPSASSASGASASASPSAAPTATPFPTLAANAVATQLTVPRVGINVVVHESTSDQNDAFPDECCAFVLQGSSEPGHGSNSYIFAHAMNTLFKPLWNVQLGDKVLVKMSDGHVIQYRITEVHPNVACPDPNADHALDPPDPPLALRYAPKDCSQGHRWIAATKTERLTMQTSQGFNRNWGELVVVAEPVSLS
ncbi:MAG: sortase [Chloroflexota bacterium]